MLLDTATIKEAVPSLIFSFIGMILMGKALEIHASDVFTKYIPHIFIINSMLVFKNNIELNYADIMSTYAKKAFEYEGEHSPLEYIVGCGSKMLFNSFVVSLLIGIFSTYKHVHHLVFVSAERLYGNVLASALIVLTTFLAGISSSLFVVFSVVACVYFSHEAGIDSDNIMLPIVSSLADYISVLTLLYFGNTMFAFLPECFPIDKVDSSFARYRMGSEEAQVFVSNCLMITVLSVLLMSLHFFTKTRVDCEFFNIYSLTGTFLIASLSGWLLQVFSEWHSVLGVLIPSFNGLAGSVILVYISRATTYYAYLGERILNNSPMLASPKIKNPANKKIFTTLLFITAIMALLSTGSLRFLFSGVSVLDSVYFGAMIILQYNLLFLLTQLILKLLLYLDLPLDCSIVPLMNASSDLLGTTLFTLGFAGLHKATGLAPGK
jgi:Divalent cation transporter